MAGLYVCERQDCQSMFTTSAVGRVQLQIAPQAQHKPYELCPGCISDFVDFMATAPAEGKRRKSYREPFDPRPPAVDLSGVPIEELARAFVRATGRELTAGSDDHE